MSHHSCQHMLECLGTSLHAAGFDLVQPLALSWYNNSVPAELGCRIKALGSAGGDALVLLVGNSKALWPKFLAACAASGPAPLNPLDTYMEQALEGALAAAQLASRPRVWWSHRQAVDLEGGGRYVAMQRMAAAAGVAYLDQVSHLCMHPTYGAWFSLRCAIVLDDIAYSQPQPPPLCNPLSADRRAAVKAAMDAALAASAAEDGEGGTPGMSGVREAWRLWLAVREAACPGHPWRYSEEQAMYHYTGQRKYLEAALQRYRESPAAEDAGDASVV